MEIFSIILIIVACIAIKTENKVFNPITILYSLWAIIIFNSKIRLFTLFKTSDNYYRIIYIGLIMFGITYYFLKIFFQGNIVKCNLNLNKMDKIYVIRMKLCILLSSICIVFLMVDFIQNQSQLFQYGFNLASVQRTLQENQFAKKGIYNAIRFLLINPMYLALTVVLATDFILGSKNKVNIMLVIVMTILRVITTGGRQAFIQMFFIVVILMGYRNYDNLKKKIKEKRKTFIFIFFAVLILLILTLSRTKSMLKTLYLDFAMQPYMFEKWAEYLNKNEINSHGMTFFIGLIYPIFYIVKNVFGINMPEFISHIYNITLLPIKNWIYIGKILKANAYVSIFWYFYMDFRIYGVIFGMIILAIISYNVFQNSKKKNNLKNIAIYTMIALTLFYSFGDYELAKPNFVLAFLYVHFLLFKKVKYDNENNKIDKLYKKTI